MLDSMEVNGTMLKLIALPVLHNYSVPKSEKVITFQTFCKLLKIKYNFTST